MTIAPSAVPLTMRAGHVPILAAERVLRHAEAVGAARMDDVAAFVRTACGELRALGINPDAILGMSCLETDHWRSRIWATRLNPGGLGVTDGHDLGYGFATGRLAALAMGVHLMAYAKGHDNRLAPYIHLDPRFAAVHAAGFAGSARTLAGLGNGKWASDPDYKVKVAARIEEMSRA